MYLKGVLFNSDGIPIKKRVTIWADANDIALNVKTTMSGTEWPKVMAL